MPIEIRQMLIKSQVVQRAADGSEAAQPFEPRQQGERDWRAECRRLIREVLDERKER
jgi:hypothetical protein